ncbi:pyridoxal-phosphate dependent enzyme [Streptomyces chryseus]
MTRHATLCNNEISQVRVAEVAQLIEEHIVRTPMLQAIGPADCNVYLKCENLQITNSFKLRGAASALLSYQIDGSDIWEIISQRGIAACSSGNFAQAMAYMTAKLSLEYSVLVPDHVPQAKVSRILDLNPDARIVKVPYATWREVMISSSYPGCSGYLLSSELNDLVSLGNATVGREIHQDIPEVETYLVPYGGGNLSYSIASLLKAVGSKAKVYAVEVSTGAPLTASVAAGHPVEVKYETSLVDGIGASFVIPSQFHRVKNLLSGVLTVTPEEISAAMSELMFSHKIVAEGAGAAGLAAVNKYAEIYGWKSACTVVSGGVIDPDILLRSISSPPMLATAEI